MGFELMILQGDAIEQLRMLPDESVHCCVTSPPYWGLRDYGTCGCAIQRLVHPPGTIFGSAPGQAPAGPKPPDPSCPICRGSGKVKGVSDAQMGLEKTPEEYVAKMVEVFREVRRVLRKDGTLWLNLGDSYASNPAKGGSGPNGKNTPEMGYGRAMRRGSGRADGIVTDESPRNRDGTPCPPGLKPKDLCGIPWRLAFALQADGWWLRSDIIWHKPNPMPESVTDRPTKSHEYLFLLTKSANYFYDAEAIKEANSSPGQLEHNLKYAKPYSVYDERAGATGQPGNVNNVGIHSRPGLNGRNKRSVWTVATAPYPEAHFATYPPDLIKPCIMAGTSAKGCCAKCGAPWERIVESESIHGRPNSQGIRGNDPSSNRFFDSPQRGTMFCNTQTTGWQPTCKCDAAMVSEYVIPEGGGVVELSYPLPSVATVPCTVLDPFAGSGTTGAVALELGRKAILIELNPKYVELIEQRCHVTQGMALA